MPPLLSVFVGIMILMYLNSKFDFSFNVYALCWLIVWFFGNLVCHSVFRYRHSVTFNNKGIVIKDGKLEQNIPWKDIKNIYCRKTGFKSMRIETLDESSHIKIHYIPLELLFSFIKRGSEFNDIEKIVEKYAPNKLIYDEKESIVQDNTNVVSYTLRRKTNLPFILVYLSLIVGVFLCFDLQLAISITCVFTIFLALSLKFYKDDLVFDGAGITVYRNRNISIILWEDINTISISPKSGEDLTLSIYYMEDGKNPSIKWKFLTYGNVHGDLYDYFRKVSELRGKSAIDWKSEV